MVLHQEYSNFIITPWRPQTSLTAVTLNNFHLEEALTIFILMIIPGIGILKWHKELRVNLQI